MSTLPPLLNRKSTTEQKKVKYNFILTDNKPKKTREHNMHPNIELSALFKRTKSLLNSKLMNEEYLSYDRYLELFSDLKQDLRLDRYLSKATKRENVSILPSVNSRPTRLVGKENLREELENERSSNFMTHLPSLMYSSRSKITVDEIPRLDSIKPLKNSIKSLTSSKKLKQDEDRTALNVKNCLYRDRSEFFKQIEHNRNIHILESKNSTMAFLTAKSNKKAGLSFDNKDFKNETYNTLKTFDQYMTQKNMKASEKFNLDYDAVENFNDYFAYLVQKKNEPKERDPQDEQFKNSHLRSILKLEDLPVETREQINGLKDLNNAEMAMIKEISNILAAKNLKAPLDGKITKALLQQPVRKIRTERCPSIDFSVVNEQCENNDKVRSKSCLLLKLKSGDLFIADTDKYVIKVIGAKSTKCIDLTDLAQKYENSKNNLVTLKSTQIESMKPLNMANLRNNLNDNEIEYASPIPSFRSRNEKNKEYLKPMGSSNKQTKTNEKSLSSKRLKKKRSLKKDIELNPLDFTNYNQIIEESRSDFKKLNEMLQKNVTANDLSFVKFISTNKVEKPTLWMTAIDRLVKSDNLSRVTSVGYFMTSKLLYKDFFAVVLDAKEKRNWSEAVERKFVQQDKNTMKSRMECLEAFVLKTKTDIEMSQYVMNTNHRNEFE